MNSLEKPVKTVSSVFCDCLNSKRDDNLKKRLEDVKDLIESAEENYRTQGEVKSLHLILPANGVATCVTTDEMEDLYSGVFARKSSKKMRPVYDEIKLAPKNNICPICAHRDVSTLDHYLPKAKNPSLAVTPLNLIPACFECNHIKDDYHPTKAEEQLLHPYFDVLNDEIWLIADVGKTKPPSITYAIQTSANWNSTLAAKLKFHFEKFRLAELYSSQAGKELSGIAGKLKSAWERDGESEVRFVLQEDAQSWEKFAKNSWQAALYRGLSESTWFCSTGYALIME